MLRRYSPRPFPPYRHRPGSTPHPIRDAAGHSYGKETAPQPIDEADWRRCDTYLFAIDLMNEGYYWEAHEELESLWLGAGRDSEIGQFLQGLIQAAAALLKMDARNLRSAGRLVAAAGAKLRRPGRVFLGIDGSRLADSLERKLAEDDPDPVVIELDLPA